MDLLLPTRLALVLAALPLIAHALTPSQVFEKVKDSVVVIKTLDAQGKVFRQGSGVLLPSGKVATNCHVVEGGVRFQAGRAKSLMAATLYAGDDDKDICLLQVDRLAGTPAQLGKAAALKVGEAVYAVGAPQGLELSMSDGIVSALRGGSPPLIQTTAAISHGSSGGGLFNSEGRLVGFTTLYIDGGQSLNFAMPVEWLADIQPGKKASTKNRGHTEWIARAAALEKRQDWSGLLDWGKQWAEAEPQNFSAWVSIGEAYANLNQYDQAIDAYREALRIDPDDARPFAMYNLGVAFSRIKRYDDAIAAYREALRIDPEDAGSWSSMGQSFFRIKRYDDAIAAYREALRIDPEDAESWNDLAIVYYVSGNTTAALQVIKVLRRLDPPRADLLFNLMVPH